ncbi:hypothetical protein AVEN_4622-1 [Araneus ventricosus]|uniref:Uncharacterized protein n=1 Tax=Araneus ventricosus TaxID=182803 RepID=A0A4Y2SXU2_ARAVE|nr:hypothetical protein AVEN_4622-1 [Araneus ventricosus]
MKRDEAKFLSVNYAQTYIPILSPSYASVLSREPTSHEHRYFHLTKIKGYISQKKENVLNSEITLANSPVPPTPDLPVIIHRISFVLSSDSEKLNINEIERMFATKAEILKVKPLLNES